MDYAKAEEVSLDPTAFGTGFADTLTGGIAPIAARGLAKVFDGGEAGAQAHDARVKHDQDNHPVATGAGKAVGHATGMVVTAGGTAAGLNTLTNATKTLVTTTGQTIAQGRAVAAAASTVLAGASAGTLIEVHAAGGGGAHKGQVGSGSGGGKREPIRTEPQNLGEQILKKDVEAGGNGGGTAGPIPAPPGGWGDPLFQPPWVKWGIHQDCLRWGPIRIHWFENPITKIRKQLHF